jgi:hypothetical protein
MHVSVDVQEGNLPEDCKLHTDFTAEDMNEIKPVTILSLTPRFSEGMCLAPTALVHASSPRRGKVPPK